MKSRQFIGSVITADIVHSTGMTSSQRRKLMTSIDATLAGLQYVFYRGDSFQVFIPDTTQGLMVILKLRLLAKMLSASSAKPSLDIRAGLGIGKVHKPIEILNTNPDEAFVLSGRSLDDLAGSKSRLRIVSNNPTANTTLMIIARFMDFMLNQITAKQSAVLYNLLLGQTQAEAAKKLKKSQATINKQANAAGWKELERLLAAFNETIIQFELQ